MQRDGGGRERKRVRACVRALARARVCVKWTKVHDFSCWLSVAKYSWRERALFSCLARYQVCARYWTVTYSPFPPTCQCCSCLWGLRTADKRALLRPWPCDRVRWSWIPGIPRIVAEVSKCISLIFRSCTSRAIQVYSVVLLWLKSRSCITLRIMRFMDYVHHT
jgi:hypothetical protein